MMLSSCRNTYCDAGSPVIGSGIDVRFGAATGRIICSWGGGARTGCAMGDGMTSGVAVVESCARARPADASAATTTAT